jgi:hypothetical protein
MSNNPLQDVFDLFDAGKLKDQNEVVLERLYNTCVNCQGNELFSRTKADHIAKAILSQMARLQNEKLAEQVVKLTQVADAQKQLAIEAGNRSEELTKQTNKLVEVANAQKQLAEDAGKQATILTNQTGKLIRLTWGLVALSVALLVFALAQTAIMIKQDTGAHSQQIQAGKNQTSTSTNK